MMLTLRKDEDRPNLLSFGLVPAARDLPYGASIIPLPIATSEDLEAEADLRAVRERVQRLIAADKLGEARDAIANKGVYTDLRLSQSESVFEPGDVIAYLNASLVSSNGRLNLDISLSREAAPYNDPVRPYIFRVSDDDGKMVIPGRTVTFDQLMTMIDDFTASILAARRLYQVE